MKTRACQLLGIEVPILQAPMEGAVGPALAAAVSNAGGLGMLAPWVAAPDEVRREIRETRALTDRPFAVNLNPDFSPEERLAVCLEEAVPIISLFWRAAPQLVGTAKAAGAVVLYTADSAAFARQAVGWGADAVVAQGWEAGGHVRGTVASLPLIPAVVDAVTPVPVIAAGGIADGRGLAAALCLGASAAWIGTRFLAAAEALAHPAYVARLLAARETDSVYLDNLFDIGWPDAPHRVLRNATVDAWEAAGRPPAGKRPGEGQVIASSPTLGNIHRYSSDTPGRDIEGDVEAMSLYAGQSAGLVQDVKPAAEILRAIVEEAEAVLEGLNHGAPAAS